MRSKTEFPIKEEQNLKLCYFLNKIWENGWLDEYSDEHFLIKAIENRLTTFIGKEQLIQNDLNLQGMIKTDGSIDTTIFNLNFCINFSRRMQFLSQMFGEENIKKFVMNQMSAGKQKYNEDTFFQALSEVSILSFYVALRNWKEAIYEPAVGEDNNKNPEARFIGAVSCSTNNQIESEYIVTVNIEVKSPEFSHDQHVNEKIAIPTMLLTNEGRKEVRKFCEKHNVMYLDPRVLKLRGFINSAASKFTIPKENEFNILYINWSYRDFPSNSFLEAWSLMTNEKNGIMTRPEYGREIGITSEAYEKITAIVVYTESIEGLMFSDFRHVWQRCGAGPRFRMWVVDEKMRNDEWGNYSDILLRITGMNPSKELTQMAMIDYKSKTIEEGVEAAVFASELVKIIRENAK